MRTQNVAAVPSVSSAEAPPDAAVPPQPRSRRAVLAATLGALGGVVASALGRPAETLAGDRAPW